MPQPDDRSMQDLKPTVWIGKQGCTKTMIDEIVSQLKKRRMIKVKWLQNTEVEPEEVAAQAKARIVEVRGRTMVLAEKGKAVQTPEKSIRKVTAKAMARSAARSLEKSSVKTPEKDASSAKPRQTGAIKRAKK